MINWKHEAKIVGAGSGALFLAFLAIACLITTLGLLAQWGPTSFLTLVSIPLGIFAVRATLFCGSVFFRLWRKRP